MTKEEWLQVGYSSGAIQEEVPGTLTFYDAYSLWFSYKSGQVRAQSLDRMECTYNRWYLHSALPGKRLSEIDEKAVVAFLNGIFADAGTVTLKEYRRIYQIVNNVLCYALDFGLEGARLLNWRAIKEYTYTSHVVSQKKPCASVKDSDIAALRTFILSGGYYKKQSASLLLLVNFYLGLRVGELAALEWTDLDTEKRILYVSKSEVKKYDRLPDGTRRKMVYEISGTKTENGTRRVPVCDQAAELFTLLAAHHRKMGYQSARMLYDGADVIGIRSLDGTLRRLCRLVEIPAFGTHMIRKTVATKMHYSGMPTRMIADMLGHADISTTEKCYILTDAEYFAAVSHALNDVFVY